MSYILDALRRADAERERGAVPGLHSQAFPNGDNGLEPRPGPPAWAWVLVGMCLVLLGAVLWLWLGRDAPPEVRPAPQPRPVTMAEPASLPVPVPTAAPPPVPPPLPAPAPAPAPASASASVSVSVPRKPAPAEPPAELRAPPLSALPESLRRELPQLMVGGSVYAKTPANRILILNGQPFHEGDTPMAELVLEQIKLKSAVLKYKGQRFELTY